MATYGFLTVEGGKRLVVAAGIAAYTTTGTTVAVTVPFDRLDGAVVGNTAAPGGSSTFDEMCHYVPAASFCTTGNQLTGRSVTIARNNGAHNSGAKVSYIFVGH